jgi:hypothetical protein
MDWNCGYSTPLYLRQLFGSFFANAQEQAGCQGDHSNHGCGNFLQPEPAAAQMQRDCQKDYRQHNHTYNN